MYALSITTISDYIFICKLIVKTTFTQKKQNQPPESLQTAGFCLICYYLCLFFMKSNAIFINLCYSPALHLCVILFLFNLLQSTLRQLSQCFIRVSLCFNFDNNPWQSMLFRFECNILSSLAALSVRTYKIIFGKNYGNA